MQIEELRKKINESDYWDCRVMELNCQYFADEIDFTYFIRKNQKVKYHFTGCYYSQFDHLKNYDKLRPAKQMELPQIPCFLQEIAIEETSEESKSFLSCTINAFPLYIKILCEDLNIIMD